MSELAKQSPLLKNKAFDVVEMDINITDGYDSGETGIHQSRFSIPAQSVYLPFISGFVKDDPLVGTGASIAVGTDDVGSDPDNILDTQAITSLDAENDCITPSIGTAIVNNADEAADVYYNVTDAELTSGKLRVAGILFHI